MGPNVLMALKSGAFMPSVRQLLFCSMVDPPFGIAYAPERTIDIHQGKMKRKGKGKLQNRKKPGDLGSFLNRQNVAGCRIAVLLCLQ
jgi:hypothetical protein